MRCVVLGVLIGCASAAPPEGPPWLGPWVPVRELRWVGVDGELPYGKPPCALQGSIVVGDGDHAVFACSGRTLGFAQVELAAGVVRWPWPVWVDPEPPPPGPFPVIRHSLRVEAVAVDPGRAFGYVWQSPTSVELSAAVLGRDGWIAPPRELGIAGSPLVGIAFEGGALAIDIDRDAGTTTVRVPAPGTSQRRIAGIADARRSHELPGDRIATLDAAYASDAGLHAILREQQRACDPPDVVAVHRACPPDWRYHEPTVVVGDRRLVARVTDGLIAVGETEDTLAVIASEAARCGKLAWLPDTAGGFYLVSPRCLVHVDAALRRIP